MIIHGASRVLVIEVETSSSLVQRVSLRFVVSFRVTVHQFESMHEKIQEDDGVDLVNRVRKRPVCLCWGTTLFLDATIVQRLTYFLTTIGN